MNPEFINYLFIAIFIITVIFLIWMVQQQMKEIDLLHSINYQSRKIIENYKDTLRKIEDNMVPLELLLRWEEERKEREKKYKASCNKCERCDQIVKSQDIRLCQSCARCARDLINSVNQFFKWTVLDFRKI